ncbi:MULTISPECIES: PspC domain-containing protein [Bacteroides]|jgi:phage shock protein PspC (stress-responsive transcriptional regulator)|uniref:PspC domain-containing protein n=1 Tax=Bacteroides TaxID=816 RepID=UPI0003399DCE|nr:MULTISPECIES: PspC domain-containing protein [Bacteroides]MDO3389357.1 PspC domain-containing protein [Bacteroides sp. ET489]CDB10178.1 putative uncharacterized protein [Bacteroides sp. CAG:633]
MSTDKKLRRPRNGRMIAGVCAGLAEFFGLDVSLVRIVYTLATIFSAFSGVIIYFLMVLIVPEEENRYFRQ